MDSNDLLEYHILQILNQKPEMTQFAQGIADRMNQDVKVVSFCLRKMAAEKRIKTCSNGTKNKYFIRSAQTKQIEELGVYRPPFKKLNNYSETMKKYALSAENGR